MNQAFFVKTPLLFLLLFFFVPVVLAQVKTDPDPPIAENSVVLYFDKTGTGLQDYKGDIYAHIGLTIDGKEWQQVIGEWGENEVQPKLKHESGNSYSLELTPSLYAYFDVNEEENIEAIDVVFRSTDGSQQTEPDYKIEVGALQITNTFPKDGDRINGASGEILTIKARANQVVEWQLLANDQLLHSASGISYEYRYTLKGNTDLTLIAKAESGEEKSISFTVETKPEVIRERIPLGIEQGINYDSASKKVTLALYAPGKDYVHVIGDFNEWEPSADYVMKRDIDNGDLFWLEIGDLDPNETYTFQYRINDGVKTADPYSTLVLSPYDDPYISSSTYPNMPEYPEGQEFEVSVIQLNQEEYEWTATDFVRPDKEDLIIYELLIRDFNKEKTWKSLIDDFDYLKNLNINAIEILPVMEFEGNSSWGYNTAYHLALDKAYGDQNSMKAFIDLCHQNGIAVILDVALNHVYGRSPLVRMWMKDDGNGFGPPTALNPYLNTEDKHAYGVGYDLNHQSRATNYYVKRTVEYWMKEFKIDGFRWDLTKGFTNNCSPGDEACTNAYQADRVAILKEYADYQWAIDPDFYVIFEHLGHGGSHDEQIEWANYRAEEGKGIMLWDKWTGSYNQNTMGYPENSNFNAVNFTEQGYGQPANVVYAESHDEERLMYKNLRYGNEEGNYRIKDLQTALNRQKAMAATLFTIPGPKIFWQFGELGHEYSINNCEDNTEDEGCRTDPSPLPADLGYLTDSDRLAVYHTWADIIGLRRSNEVFKTNTYSIESGNLLPIIHIWNDGLAEDELNYVVVVANFKTADATIYPNFPTLGTWTNLMEETELEVTSTGNDFGISLAPGEFRIYGNQAAEELEVPKTDKAVVYPNPSSEIIHFSETVEDVQIFDIAGRRVLFIEHKIRSQSPINIGNLQRGVYIIKARTQSDWITFKLIKS